MGHLVDRVHRELSREEIRKLEAEIEKNLEVLGYGH